MTSSAESFAPWPARPPATAPADTAALAEAAHAAAHASGYADGYRAGAAAAEIAHAAAQRQLAQLVETLAAPLAGLDATLEQAVLDLVLALAAEVVRAELSLSPRLVAGVVRDALQALAHSGEPARIELHPDDARLLRATLQGHAGPPYTVIEDASIARGGARVRAGVATVDATVQTRLAEAAERLTGAHGRGA